MERDNIKNVQNIQAGKKGLYIGLIVMLLIIVGSFSFFGPNLYKKYQVSYINSILEKGVTNVQNCRIIMSYDINKENKYLEVEKLLGYRQICEEKFSIEDNFEEDDKLLVCRNLLSKNDKYLEDNYINVYDIEGKREECLRLYFKPVVEVSEFFSLRKDLKTSLQINFPYKLFAFDNIDKTGNEENEQTAKTIIMNNLEIEPKVELSLDDIELDDEIITLNLDLKPEIEYRVGFKNVVEIYDKGFNFTTPEEKLFSLRALNPVSLYTKGNLPQFEIWDYNTEKTTSKVKICKVSEEDYAKIEVFKNYEDREESKEFFSNMMPEINQDNCEIKEVKIKETSEESQSLKKVGFNFDEYLSGNEKNGLYFVSFVDKENINFDGKSNTPIFFGVINSNILMKISKQGQGFFFVNDFEGNPLANQKIIAYTNNYYRGKSSRNSETKKRETSFNSPLDDKVFSGSINLGETDKNGILKVDLDGKIEDYFARTFGDEYSSGERNRKDFYKTFFVKSVGENNLSYLVSAWNAGIEPWNFGYSLGRYDRNDSEYKNSFDLDSYTYSIKNYNSSIFTDRVLYLPGEEVNIKGVVRNAEDLSIPNKNLEFNLFVKDSKDEEILNKLVTLNEFGSFSESITLLESASLGNYNIYLTDKDGKSIGYSGFNVEIFKNPKFKNEVGLETSGLNGENVQITETEKTDNRWRGDKYVGNFKIKGLVTSEYYNGNEIKNVDFTYKVYKQYYYESSYWDNCYYGCYREPSKQFYTEGKGKIGEDGIGKFEIPIEFESYYDDYKYIVEVTVKDEAGDTITGSNSIIARLPDEYKKYNGDLSFYIKPESRFLEVGDTLKIIGGLNNGEWEDSYNNRNLVVIKRKVYNNKEVTDVNGYKRNVEDIEEEIYKVLLVNDKNFKVNDDGDLEYDFKPEINGEYIFEYGKVNRNTVGEYFNKKMDLVTFDDIKNVVEEFNNQKTLFLDFVKKETTGIFDDEYNPIFEDIGYKISLKSLISNTDNYFPIIVYDDKVASNPIQNDNKINVISEKVSYKVGEIAKILIRLPVSNSRILITTEKRGVVNSEYVEVKGNVFFKQIKVDDSFSPNSYIGVFMVDKENKIPEYKVGYTEIVIDKTDKKAFIDLKTDKEKYSPRDEVNLNFEVKDNSGKAISSELTVMVVDDSLISLMGNIDPNILENIFIKLPFSIQTSMTNIAMLRNYYFSRKGIVGGSGFGDFKGGDSAVSTRNIFKNTAYYNPSVITDDLGKASVKFDLPDNLTNFRVMVISNSKDNHFGYSEKMIEIRKNVILEDKTPLILRAGDEAEIGANLFNNTGEEMGFKVSINMTGVEVEDKEQDIILKDGESEFLTWKISVDNKSLENIDYTISALGNSVENSDKLTNSIEIKQSPILLNTVFRDLIVTNLSSKKEIIEIPENTDYANTFVEINFSNNRINGIEKIAKSLASYPYGCVEQLTSTTVPNVILKNLITIIPGIYDEDKLDKNIKYGLDKIISRQNADGGFGYWEGDSYSTLHYTPYVVRGLIYMKNSGENISDEIISKAISYLENNYINAESKSEILRTLAYAGKLNLRNLGISDLTYLDNGKLDKHELLALTYAYVLKDKELYKQKIEENIKKLEQLFLYSTDDNNHRYYGSNDLDKATFVSMMMDYNYENYTYQIEEALQIFYEKDWSSYYYSTWTKNAVFVDFYKYLERNKNLTSSKFNFSIGNKQLINVSLDKGSLNKKINYKLSDLISKDSKSLSFQVNNLDKSTIYANIEINSYPENIEKVKAYSNGVNIEEEIFEVLDESKLSECSDSNYSYSKIDCSKVLKKVDGNIYDKTKLYKSKITVYFSEDKRRNNVNIEDYLPGSFSVINSNFKTESTSIRQAGSDWKRSHIESKPNVIMANVSSRRGNSRSFEYYFRPSFAGTFVNPPATVYEMYNPQNRAYNEYNIIEVK